MSVKAFQGKAFGTHWTVSMFRLSECIKRIYRQTLSSFTFIFQFKAYKCSDAHHGAPEELTICCHTMRLGVSIWDECKSRLL